MILVLNRRSGGFWLGVGLYLALLVVLRAAVVALILVLFLAGYILRRLYLRNQRKHTIAAMPARSSQIPLQAQRVQTRSSRFLQAPIPPSGSLLTSFCPKCGQQLPLPSVTDRFCQYCGSALKMQNSEFAPRE